MPTLKRTNSDDLDFQKLVVELDKVLSVLDGADHSFYAQYNKLNAIKHVIVLYENDIPVGCGAIKAYDEHTMEVKRMYVDPTQRGKGLATIILLELENWAKELGYKKCILETGKKQVDAVRLYEKNNYLLMENYGQYEGVEYSLCFEKNL
jgi:putative acetyltransferase